MRTTCRTTLLFSKTTRANLPRQTTLLLRQTIIASSRSVDAIFRPSVRSRAKAVRGDYPLGALQPGPRAGAPRWRAQTLDQSCDVIEVEGRWAGEHAYGRLLCLARRLEFALPCGRAGGGGGAHRRIRVAPWGPWSPQVGARPWLCARAGNPVVLSSSLHPHNKTQCMIRVRVATYSNIEQRFAIYFLPERIFTAVASNFPASNRSHATRNVLVHLSLDSDITRECPSSRKGLSSSEKDELGEGTVLPSHSQIQHRRCRSSTPNCVVNPVQVFGTAPQAGLPEQQPAPAAPSAYDILATQRAAKRARREAVAAAAAAPPAAPEADAGPTA
ncbi:hypothetical protein B0H11DRAFT_2300491 [Mycena galericulata]|nr:hypothetical protein B0H11DRAFT_2300491 [Mycena galericulata]